MSMMDIEASHPVSPGVAEAWYCGSTLASKTLYTARCIFLMSCIGFCQFYVDSQPSSLLPVSRIGDRPRIVQDLAV